MNPTTAAQPAASITAPSRGAVGIGSDALVRRVTIDENRYRYEFGRRWMIARREPRFTEEAGTLRRHDGEWVWALEEAVYQWRASIGGKIKAAMADRKPRYRSRGTYPSLEVLESAVNAYAANSADRPTETTAGRKNSGGSAFQVRVLEAVLASHGQTTHALAQRLGSNHLAVASALRALERREAVISYMPAGKADQWTRRRWAKRNPPAVARP